LGRDGLLGDHPPSSGTPAKDAGAKAAIQAAFPEKTVVQVNLDQLHDERAAARIA
jgi:hypothetical protein